MACGGLLSARGRLGLLELLRVRSGGGRRRLLLGGGTDILELGGGLGF